MIVFFFAGTLEWPVAGFCFFSRPEQRMLRLGDCCVTSEQEELLFTVICFRSMLNIDKRGKDRLNNQAGLKP